MKKISLVFDFDGTIADTLFAIKDIICKLYGECGYGEVKEEDIEELRGMNARRIIKKLGIPWWKIPLLIRKGKADLSANIERMPSIDGIEPVLEKLKKSDHRLYIVSSNSKENIEKFLVKKGLAETFDAVYSDSSLWGKGKILKKLMKEENLARGEAVYVGDEIRDIEAAGKIGTKIIAVTWGFNTKEALRKHNPDYLAEKPEDLLKIAEELSRA